MWLEVDSLDKVMLINGLKQLDAVSTDSIESGKIQSLIERIERLTPTDVRISRMDEEGRFWVGDEEVTPQQLGLTIE